MRRPTDRSILRVLRGGATGTAGPRAACPSRSSAHLLICSSAALALLLLTACQPDEKVLKYKPFFSNVAGAEFLEGGEPVNPNAGYSDPRVVPDNKTVYEQPDGTKKLVARSVQHMMRHLETCLDEGDDELLLEQVISERTITFYRENGRDPQELIDSLHDNRKEIARTFGRMPMGENSPTVILSRAGDRTWIVKITGAATKGLKFTKLWARLEGANWKFMWLE